MKTLEVFYDYACPFCRRGHGYLTALLPELTEIEINWRPCEAHPRPEQYGRHSDLCARGMYIAWEQGADLMEYHRRMYEAALSAGENIEDPAVLAEVVDGLLDPNAFREALWSGAYEAELEANNRAAWDEQKFDAVPSLVLGDQTLPAVPGIGLTEEAVRRFLRGEGD